LEAGEVVVAPGSFQARPVPGAVRSLSEVGGALARSAAQVVDMRPAGRFTGTDPEPRAGVPSGHMPGALNLPYTDLVGADGSVLAPDRLRARLAAAGIRLERPVIATCGSGVSACTLLLALEILGHRDYALFDGSWTEWATAGMPRANGASTDGEPA
jgi:thiosulfate/3-mercaptopyruvate sulfurtransferase